MTKEEQMQYNKRYREAHKERIKEYEKKYRETHKEHIREYQKEYRAINNEHLKEQNRQYYKDNKEKWEERHFNNREHELKRMKEYHSKNKEKVNIRHRKYYRENKEKIIEQHRQDKYRIGASKRNCTKEFSPIQNELLNLSKGETSKYVNFRATAQPQAYKTENRTSKRKGVYYLKKINKWCASLTVNKVNILKQFKTEQEAIDYRIYLENTYYTPEQLAIRDKYSK